MTVLSRIWVLFVLSLVSVSALADTEAQTVRIGVLSHRGDALTLARWTPTADYLSQVVPGYHFKVVPLDFHEVDPAVKFGQIDFILVNPGIYVNLEVRYRVSRIATLNNRIGTHSYNVFGGVLFTRADRDDIRTLEDLKGKRLMAVDRTSLGGFQMAWREMKSAGVDPYRDLRSLTFGGIHDEVVRAVRDGRADVGTVRTKILERMASEGQIDLEDFRVINPQLHPEFPLNRSTRLYPEWPFSKLRHTDNRLAQKVAVALLQMPENHPATLAGQYASWTIPLDYQPVHELFQELQLPPYAKSGRFTLWDAMRKYWYWLLVGLVFLVSLAVMTTWIARLNCQLKRSKLTLEQQHELILNSVADGIYGVDLEGNSTFVNRAMERITGWRAEELIGRNQHEMLHHTRADGSAHPAEECPVYATHRDNRPRYVDDDLFWRKDGSSFPVEYASTPIRDGSGKTVGSVVVFRDISARKKAEEESRQHQLDLAHVARLSTLGEMASGIAHEINQPLTAIATNAQAGVRLLESGETRRIADILERIGSQAERAGEIIRQLRQMVRKEAPERTAVDLNQVVRGVVTLLKPEARRQDVQVRLELNPDIGPVLAQHVQLDQVVLNLARNAMEAMVEANAFRRLLLIRTTMREPGMVTVTVADTGPGLAGQSQEMLFTPFYTTKPKGMGLGLSISRSIIEAHGGRLVLSREPGYTAVFRFSLPVYQGDSDSA